MHGVALGGGLELALACDIIIAADSAKFGMVEVTLGLHPLMGGIQRVAARAGLARAKEMALFGRRIDAVTLEKWGVINLVVPELRLAEVTRTMVEELAAGPGVAHAATKKLAAVFLNEGIAASDRAMADLQRPDLRERGSGAGAARLPRKRSRPCRLRRPLREMAMSNQGPLSGLRVVDFSRVLAGPHCTKLLLDLGADVIKLEPPSGDISRVAFPRDETASMSGYYIQQNAGKRNISVDLNYPEGRAIAYALCDRADIIVENFRAGTLKFFGMDYATIAKRNPRVIYASISGYGQGGALSHRSAYAPTVHAETGFLGGMIDHLGDDLRVNRHDAYSHADVYTGLEAAVAILAALHRREQSGEGQYIDVAMAATMLAVNERAHAILSDEDLGAEPAALGPAESPFFTTAYGDTITIATSIVSSLTFQNYIAAMRRPDLAEDPRFLTTERRRQHVDALHAIIQRWINTFPTPELLDAQLDEVKLAFGSVRTTREFADSDWARWWGAVEEVSDRQGHVARIPGKPWRFSKDALPPAKDPSYRGENNAEIPARAWLFG